ncbi:hypothetical protein MBLNU230_g1885t1 [Neophaeotheca triangularis]
MALIETKKKCMLAGLRASNHSKVWYQPGEKKDEDGGREKHLLKCVDGPGLYREPMECEVVWLIHFDVKTFPSNTLRGRLELQRQFLSDAYEYLVEASPDEAREIERKTAEDQRDSRWQSWFDYAKVWKQTRIKRKEAYAKRKKIPIEDVSDDEGFDEGDDDDAPGPGAVNVATLKGGMGPPPRSKKGGGAKRKRGSDDKGGKGKRSRGGATPTSDTLVRDMSLGSDDPMMSGGNDIVPAFHLPRAVTGRRTNPMFIDGDSDDDFQETSAQEFRQASEGPRGHTRQSMEAARCGLPELALRMANHGPNASGIARKLQRTASPDEQEDAEGLDGFGEGFLQAGSDISTRAGRGGLFAARAESASDEEYRTRARAANGDFDYGEALERAKAASMAPEEPVDRALEADVEQAVVASELTQLQHERDRDAWDATVPNSKFTGVATGPITPLTTPQARPGSVRPPSFGRQTPQGVQPAHEQHHTGQNQNKGKDTVMENDENKGDQQEKKDDRETMTVDDNDNDKERVADAES